MSGDGEFTVEKLEKMPIAEQLALADRLEIWIKAVREDANSRALMGERIVGYKLVKVSGLRKWTDAEQVEAILSKTFDKADICNSALKSPAQIEKAIGKVEYAKVSHLVESPDRGLTLVPEADRRPEFLDHAKIIGLF